MIKRRDIWGFTLHFFKYYLEFVFIKKRLVEIDLSKYRIIPIWRLEI